jgi:hypothetical protein
MLSAPYIFIVHSLIVTNVHFIVETILVFLGIFHQYLNVYM